ncbi:MAG: hypothetical protein ABLT11_00940 [Candidatus Acidiferrum sp.]
MKKLVILSAIAGFGGAALFYSNYLGIHVPDLDWCVVCPNITSIAPKKLFFAKSFFFLGLPNSLFYFCVFGIFRAFFKHFARSHG